MIGLIGLADDVRTDRKIKKLLLEKGYEPGLVDNIMSAWHFINIDEGDLAKLIEDRSGAPLDVVHANGVLHLSIAFKHEDIGFQMIPDRNRRERYKQQLADNLPTARAILEEYTKSQAKH